MRTYKTDTEIYAMKEKEKQLSGLNGADGNAAVGAKKDKKQGKLFIILSYVLVLAGLIAALFVPLYDGDMLIKYLLASVSEFLSLFSYELAPSVYGSFFIEAELMIYQWALILALAVSLVLALIMLIPVIAGKPAKNTNLNCAFAAEFIAFTVVLVFTVCELFLYAGEWYNYSVLIPLGITALVMAAQSIKYKGGSGVAKFIIFLLALVTLFTLFDIVAVIPALEDPLLSLSGTLGAYDADVTFMGAYPDGLSGLYEIIMLYESTDYLLQEGLATPELVSRILFSVLSIFLVISIFTDLLGLVAGRKTRKSGEPHTHKGWFAFAIVRYLAIIVLIAAIVLLGLFLDGSWKAGLYMYFAGVAVLLTLVVEVIRYCAAKAKLSKYKAAQKELFNAETIVISDPALAGQTEAETEAYVAQTAENAQLNFLGEEAAAAPAYVEEPVEEQPAEDNGEQLTIAEIRPAEEPAAEALPAEIAEEQPAPVAAQPEPVIEQPAPAPAPVYAAPVYTAPVAEPVQPAAAVESAAERPAIDPFVDKLTDSERAEFFDVFVNRNRGKIASIPVYELNGDNALFFASVFVHINRTRELCSDSLLMKIYKEIGRN